MHMGAGRGQTKRVRAEAVPETRLRIPVILEILQGQLLNEIDAKDLAETLKLLQDRGLSKLDLVVHVERLRATNDTSNKNKLCEENCLLALDIINGTPTGLGLKWETGRKDKFVPPAASANAELAGLRPAREPESSDSFSKYNPKFYNELGVRVGVSMYRSPSALYEVDEQNSEKRYAVLYATEGGGVAALDVREKIEKVLQSKSGEDGLAVASWKNKIEYLAKSLYVGGDAEKACVSIKEAFPRWRAQGYSFHDYDLEGNVIDSEIATEIAEVVDRKNKAGKGVNMPRIKESVQRKIEIDEILA